MPRRTQPPACSRTALLRTKARREALALAADRRAEREAAASAKRKAAAAAQRARAATIAEMERRYYEETARPAPPVSAVKAEIHARYEESRRALMRAMGCAV